MPQTKPLKDILCPSLSVYSSWLRLNPFFLLRLYLHDLGHPRSPLFSTTLMHAAFFSRAYIIIKVPALECQMTEYKSLIWPLRMMFQFVDVKRVLLGCRGLMLVVAGEEDKLMKREDMKLMTEIYEGARKDLLQEKKVNDEVEGAVKCRVVEDSGHHLMNDLHWEEAVRIIEDWLK